MRDEDDAPAPNSADPIVRDFLARAKGPAIASPRARVISLDTLAARAGEPTPPTAARWSYAALRGRFVELSARGATATLTTAMALVVDAQATGEPVCWITPASASFYPPDAADTGVDLAALVVVRAPTLAAELRAAERVLRSGAFGLVVIDFGAGEAGDGAIAMADQGRLVTLAQTHDAAVVCLTEKAADAASLGSLISLRVEALRQRGEHATEVTLRALKDKKRGPGWTQALGKRRGPAGT